MRKKILDVGQCDADHGAICRLFQKHFDADVERADGADDTLAALREQSYDLVLINRKLDRDQSDGVAIIHQIKNDDKLTLVPVMLVTNFSEHQQTAMVAGAEPGFGKAALETEETLERLKQVLDSR